MKIVKILQSWIYIIPAVFCMLEIAHDFFKQEKQKSIIIQ